MKIDHNLFNSAVNAIRDGRLVAFPTETVYGLGADAFNPEAVARIFEAKQRPFLDPLIVHIASVAELESLASSLPGNIDEIVAAFWPGPLTLVLPKRRSVPDIVTSGLDTVAVRWPEHPLALKLIRAVETSIAAPSANLFGRVSPTTADHVREQLADRVDVILDGGSCGVGVESTIISYTEGFPRLLRHGGCPQEELQKVMGEIAPARESSSPEAPGMLAKHYAPHTRMLPIERYTGGNERVGVLCFRGISNINNCVAMETLSGKGDLREAAANLFSAMRRLDKADIELILVEKFPEHGLGRAINDRLDRACATFDS